MTITAAQVNARVDKMKVWAGGVEVRIKQLQNSLAPDVEQARIIEQSMDDLYAIQVTCSGDMALLDCEIAEMRADIADQKERVKEITTEAMMFAEGGNADKRKAAAALALKDNTEYQAVKAALSINERGKLVKQAYYDAAEREYKRLGEQLRNLRARLQHWTARANMSIGEQE